METLDKKRLADVEDQRRREARLSAIEQFLGRLKSKEPASASPEPD